MTAVGAAQKAEALLDAVEAVPTLARESLDDGAARLRARIAAVLDTYVREAGLGEKRAEARRRIDAALAQGDAGKLDLSNLGLRQLPPFLPNVAELNLSRNRLTSLPMLPCGIHTLLVAQNQLEALPDILPGKLDRLDVSYNSLTALPETLPAGLRILDASRNALRALPSRLPLGLIALFLQPSRGPDLTQEAADHIALRGNRSIFNTSNVTPAAMYIRAQARASETTCQSAYDAYLSRALAAAAYPPLQKR